MLDESKETQIDLADLIKIIWNDKLLIISISSLITFLTLLYVIFLPNLYTSSALLKINENEESSGFSSFAAQYGGLASLAGVSLPSSSSDKTDYVIEIIKSREFAEHISKFANIKPMLIAFESYDLSTNTINFDTKIYNAKTQEWLREPINGNVAPSNLEIHAAINENLSISKNKQSGFINISFEHKSPIFSKRILDIIIRELNSQVREKDLLESTIALNYLQNEIKSIEQSEIRKAIFNLIESQLQIQMLSNVKKDYILSSIDKPFIPENKSSPARMFILIMSAFFGFLFSCIISIFKSFR